MNSGVAAIAAGGRGSRFKSREPNGNKLLTPFAGRSILQRIVDALLLLSEVDQILLLTRHDAASVEHEFAPWAEKGVIEFLRIDAENTGGAVRQVAQALGGSPFLYSDGDVLALPDLYQDLAKGLANFPKQSRISVSPRINAPTHLMVDLFDGNPTRFGQGLRGERGTHVSLGVMAIGSAFSQLLASGSESRDLDEVLEDALTDPASQCVVHTYDGPWAAIHERDDLISLAEFLKGET